MSSIRFYRVPTGRLWQTRLTGGGVEVIQRSHRYAVVWPSIHPEGRTYRWLTPDGVPSTCLPEVADLPELPTAWQDALARGAARSSPVAAIDDKTALRWLEELPKGPACPSVLKRHAAVLSALEGDSRHDDSLPAVLALLYAGAKPGSTALP